MEPITMWALATGILMACAIVSFVMWLITDKERKRLVARVERQTKLIADASEELRAGKELMQKQLDASTAEQLLGEARQVIADLKEELRIALARAESNFKAIEHIEKQRNEWSTAYDESTRTHGKAQEMLVKEISRLSLVAKGLMDSLTWVHRELARPEPAMELVMSRLPAILARKRNFEPSEHLKVVMDEYRDEHVGSLARRTADQLQRLGPQPEGVAPPPRSPH